jgi:hypothetical protein
MYAEHLTTARAQARAHGRLAVCSVVACILVVTALGHASPAAGNASRLPAIHRLSATQFTALERYLVAGLPMDEGRTNTLPQSKIDATNRAILRACRRFSRRDPLLRELRVSCIKDSDLDQALSAYNVCANAACLPDVLKAVRAGLRQAISGGRIATRAVNATHLPDRCKRTIVDSPKLFAYYERLDAAFAKVQHAMATGSAADFNAAEAALARADSARQKLLKGTPTVRRSLQLLRSTCR